MVKLFVAKSDVEGFLGCDLVTFFWHCTDREKPAFPYEEVIMDYNSLDGNQKMIAERKIDRYFTETEIMELQEYLHRIYELDLKARRIQLPIILPDGDDAIRASLEEPEFGSFPLYKDEVYNLSMRVAAEYYLSGTYPTSHDQLPTIHKKSGEMFANALFKKLNICAPTNLEKVVQEIYRETDLIVTRV